MSEDKARPTPKVWVVQEMSNHDISGALRFGEIQTLLPASVQVAFSPWPVIRTVRRKLQRMGRDDYLLLTGDPVIIGLVCAVAALYNGGRYNVLKWDKRERLYIPITIDTTEKGERDDD